MDHNQYKEIEDDADHHCCCYWISNCCGNWIMVPSLPNNDTRRQSRWSSVGIDNDAMRTEMQQQQPAAAGGGPPGEMPLKQFTASDDIKVKSQFGLGRVQFTVWYDFITSTLTLKILHATDLPAKDKNGFSDPYVKVILLPDKNKLKTNVKYKNLSPRWNEVFAFEAFPYEKVINSTLCLQVLDHDRFSKDDVIGEIILPMTSFDLANGQTLWKNLLPSERSIGRLGEICLSIRFDSNADELAVIVVKARNLKAKDLNGLSDPYVKIWRMLDGKRVEKKTTTIKEKTLNPVFEETLSFKVTLQQVRSTSLLVVVMDFDTIGRNKPIGSILLGSKSGPNEMKHWNEMFAQSRTLVTHWHLLRHSGV